MERNIYHLIDSFNQINVLVIGEAMLDSYYKGESDRLCREAPVPVVEVHERENTPGGGGNTAVNIHSLGGKPFLLSVVGDDQEGEILIQSMQERGINTHWIHQSPVRETQSKQRVIAGDQMMLRFDRGSITPLSRDDEEWLISNLDELFPLVDAVIISDYGYGVMTPRVKDRIRQLQNNSPRILVVDSKDLVSYRLLKPTASTSSKISPINQDWWRLIPISFAARKNKPGRGFRQSHSSE